MCEQGSTIRLCSCDSKELNPNCMWELYSENRIVGNFIIPEGSFGGILITLIILPFLPLYFIFRAFRKVNIITPRAKEILDQLNKGAVFDFEYVPRDGDVLIIKIKRRKYSFKYSTYRGDWAKVSNHSIEEEIVLTGSGSISNKFQI